MKTENTITVSDIRESLVNDTQRSAWDKGVTAYALDLLDGLRSPLTAVPSIPTTSSPRRFSTRHC